MRLPLCAVLLLSSLALVASMPSDALRASPAAPVAATASASACGVASDDEPALDSWPFVIHTWPWTQAADAAYDVLRSTCSTTPSLDAIVAGLSECERDQCGGTVGFGGSPDESGETTLDAMIIDGTSLSIGSVGALRGVENAIGVARAVMDHTEHTMLVGSQASDFAISMGFWRSNLTTPESEAVWRRWKEGNCQPNMRKSVLPDPKRHCGPYKPSWDRPAAAVSTTTPSSSSPSAATDPLSRSHAHISPDNHDTIAMVTMDAGGNMAAGTSTNGMAHKIPGRVGDAPIPGAGAWVDSEVGGCGSTGDGDILMRFAPCYQAVQNLRAGLTPRQAAEDALARIQRFFDFSGALVVIDRSGQHGAASWGMPFAYSVRTGEMNETRVVNVEPGVWEHVQPVPQEQVRNKRSREDRRAKRLH